MHTTPFGWGEINGTHNRTDFDLTQHQKYSGESMIYINQDNNEKFIPYIIESTVGADRLTLAILFNSYCKEELENGDIREVMKFIPKLAPYKVAILPLIKKVHAQKAQELFELLTNYFDVAYDDAGSIGKRYRRQDIYGTPFCITIDNDTLEKNTVTIRNRDTMKQETINIDDIKQFIETKL